MSTHQIDKLFDKFYANVYKVINDQSNNRRYLTRAERLQFENEKKRREEDAKKINELNFEFECGICLEEKKSDDGIRLSECYHIFCRDCIRTYIATNTDGYLICPNDQCKIYLKDFQIKSLLTESEYYNTKLKCLKRIEAELGSNGFHCKTLDCIGFCSIQSEIGNNYTSKFQKLFQCPICTEVNCINCNAIHKNKTCHEYKETFENSGMKAQNEKERENLDELVNLGEIMRCPKCSIFLQRHDGMCQYIRCFYCKMDICWLTRGPRWGPGGKGDTSGGCRCGVNGIRCHPDCTNCH